MTLRDYFIRLGYEPIDEQYYAKIDHWRAWYRGKVSSFHTYPIYNRGKKITRTRASLNMAKQGCEYWANLLWNSECTVNLADSSLDAFVNDILKRNDFIRQTNVLMERVFAMGCGAFVVTGGATYDTRIEYVPADYIRPLSWNNDDVENCAFAAAFTAGKQPMMQVMIHEKQPNGEYLVTNQFFKRNPRTNDLEEASNPYPGKVKDSYRVPGRTFAIVRPNIANNIADVPMGISVYANCIDILMSIDLAYDGIKTSMEVGRPRIGVTGNMLRVDPMDGTVTPTFDANDISVYDMGQGGKDEAAKVQDLTTQYRAREFEESLQTQLNVFSQSIGLGEKAFHWDRGFVKTATEVISNNSAMLRTMEKHQDGLRSAIIRLVQAVLMVNGKNPDVEITVAFDDSVTRDKASEAQEAWQWVVAGRFPFWKYLVDFKGYDEDEAKTIAREASASYPRTFEGEE